MNENTPRLDPVRAEGMRRMLVDSAAGSVPAPRAHRLPRPTRTALLVAAAATVVVVGGGGAVAYSLAHPGTGGGQAVAPVPTSSAQPLDPATPSSTPDPGGIVDPAGTASPTPLPTGVDTADPSSWIVTTAGIGPLTLGGSQKAAAVDAAAAYTVTAPGYDCPVDFYSPKSGSGAPELVTQAVTGDRIDLIMIGGLGTAAPAETPKTPSGIGLGATKDELLATYPDIENLTVSSAGGAVFGQTYGIEDAQGRWLTFELDEKAQVGEIDVSFTKGSPGEFC